eukprot:TRINITY_DN7369_c0_g1_i1.p1 TRINITY_DN7369_c0_g1~~TRINITY_DN7369_c0_g1_i1.p1  ORF type:complete len:165 (+),score=27.47 TRINITY_DN7369_c0_g1_i1:170-664(+)
MLLQLFLRNILLILFFIVISLAQESTYNCHAIIDEDGRVYDISPLFDSKISYTEQENIGVLIKIEYNVILCNHAKMPQCEVGCFNPGYCATTTIKEGKHSCIGEFSGATALPRSEGIDGVELVYLNGIDGLFGSVRILCDPNAELVSDVSVNALVFNSFAQSYL